MSDERAPMWRRYRRFWGPDVAADGTEELAFHIEQRVQELVALGASEADARAEAMRRMGSMEALQRACREIGEERVIRERRREYAGALLQDVRHSMRQFVRAPVLSLIVIVT